MTEKNKQISEGLTYDDVLVVPDYSEVLPSSVDISTYFTQNIKLNIPIISAAMDTVTEAGMAIAIAQEGGIGVFDRPCMHVLSNHLDTHHQGGGAHIIYRGHQ